jgi:hypothetical protein
MLYNIFGNSANWDELLLGYIRTIEVDPDKLPDALRHIAEEIILEDYPERSGCTIKVATDVDPDELYDANDVNAIFADNDAVTACATVDGSAEDYSLVWVAVPHWLTTIVVG